MKTKKRKLSSTKSVVNTLDLFNNNGLELDSDLSDSYLYGYIDIEIINDNESKDSMDNMLAIGSLCFDVQDSWEKTTDYDYNLTYNHLILTASNRYYLHESICSKQILHRLTTNLDLNLPNDFYRNFTRNMAKGRRFCKAKAIRHSNANLVIDWYLSSSIVFIDMVTFKIAMTTTKNDLTLLLMAFIHGNRLFETNQSHEFRNNTEIENFYQTIAQKQKNDPGYFNEFETIVIDYQNLRPKLWRHQQMALKWMLMRETSKENTNVDLGKQFEKIPNIKYIDENLYFHSSLGHFLTEKVYHEYIEHLKQLPTKGGILADEMGLGKTVDVIGLILNNPKPTTTSQENINFILTEQNLFQLSNNPLAGEIRCHCGMIDHNSIIQMNAINLEQLRQQCLRQQYHLVDNLIQCLMCGHFQHLECSSYSIEQSQKFGYICSHCWPQMDLIDSPATLIVCPTSILSQWIQELNLHIDEPNVKIFKYNGVKCRDYKFPPELAGNDIVITTYEILKSELDFVAAHDYSHLRNSRRYYTPVSPLCSIRWWRLIFDEAQLVEGRATRTFRMAKSLHSIHRWTVTGTPIQRNIEDLFGLINFIGEQPYNEENVWKNHLYNPFCHGEQDHLINVMTRCFWRASKASVFDEIRISKPITIMEHCDLSQIERDFYLQEASNCQQSMMTKLITTPSEMKISHLSSTIQSVIFTLALRLRQICCHPQMCLKVKLGDYCSLQDVLDKMIDDAKYDCEKCHREKIASINGMAACYLLQNDFKTAIHMYKEALTSINNVGDDIRTDKTQKYHIYYNLAQILEFVGCTQVDVNEQPMDPFNGSQSILMPGDSKPCLPLDGELPIEPDDRYLRLKAKQLYQDYLNTARLSLLTADRYRRELIKKCDQINEKFTLKGWWLVHALKELSKVMNVDEIILSLLEILGDSRQLIDPIGPRSIESIRWKLCEYLNSFEEVRQQIRDAFIQLDHESLSGNPDRYIDCHIRPPEQSVPERPERCHLCKTESVIKNFEKIIFQFNKSISINVENEEENEADNWNENLCLVAIRKLGVWFKSRTVGSAIDYDVTVADIDNFNQYIDECKKEYKAHRKCWRESCELVLRIDELNQAQTRYEHGVDSLSLFHRDSSAKEMAEEKLRTNQQRLKYLNNLKSTLKDKDNIDSKVCSVCWLDLIRYSVLTCGHLLCIECMRNISKHSETSSRCPVCRSPFDHLKICFVDSNLLVNKSSMMVEGNWSSKIVAIIRRVKQIQQESNDEKILIFSTWLRMLQLLEKALQMNHVESILISGSGDDKFAIKIDRFRKSDSCRVLLLPTRFACKGLNLTEASRIVFVNPILNKRDELQAIGRINRIGQTRQTYVHKFIIKDSIEELIENYNKECNYRTNCTNGEFTDLTVGEFCALFNVYKA